MVVADVGIRLPLSSGVKRAKWWFPCLSAMKAGFRFGTTGTGKERKMVLKDIYAKFKANRPLTDDELKYLINELKDLENTLGCLGIEFRITTNAIRADLNVLESFQFHRKNHG
jgi:hypothetical protein